LLRTTSISLFFLVTLIFVSCGGSKENEKEYDTPTSGYIQISVDETLKPMVEAVLGTFHHIYENAQIDVEFKPEADAIKDLIDRKVRIAIIPRKLTNEENDLVSSAGVDARSNITAWDAVTLITDKTNNDTLLTVDQFLSMINDIPFAPTNYFSNYSDSTIVVFNNSRSSLISFFQLNYGIKKLTANCFQLKTTDEVVRYVNEHPNTIGVIGMSWISDSDDTTSERLLKEMKMISLAKENSSERKDYFQPYQSNVYDKSYPFIREVYIHLVEPRNGLGTGFSTFMTSDKGQRIILKSGMVPANMPVRLVEIKKDDF